MRGRIVASLATALALAGAPATAQNPPVQNFAPEQLKTGAEIYARNCSPCHGARMLGVTSARRSKFLPELPTIAESGVPGYEFDTWFGLLGPAATPKAAVESINAAVGALLADPSILDRLAKQGVEPQALNPGAFNALLRADFARMAKVVKASGARID